MVNKNVTEQTAVLSCNPRFTVLLDERLRQVYLIDELESVVLFGEGIVEIIRRIDGRRTFDSIAAEVAPVLGADNIKFVVERLIEDGIVINQF